MLTIDETITESFSCKDAELVLDICQDIVLKHNYRLTSVGEDHVRLKALVKSRLAKMRQHFISIEELLLPY